MTYQKDQIDAWWVAFREKAEEIDALFTQGAEWDLPNWMHQHLQPLHPELMWEFGPAIRSSGHRLVITPEHRRYLRPLVSEILRRQPSLDGWEFYAYRLPESYDLAIKTVESRSGGDISNTFFQASIGDFNTIDLVFQAEHYSSGDEQGFHDVFVALETLLGEEVLDRWIGVIDVEPLAFDNPENHLHHIRELKTEVDPLIEQVRESLPDRPYYQLSNHEQEWTLFKLEPGNLEKMDDYPEQRDMFIGKSMIPALWQNAHISVSFDSLRYSNHGETFCYVKIDGTQGVDEEHFADKSEIEDALDNALREQQLGCFLGGGTGRMYSYVDLALVDVDRGVKVIQEILQAGNIPKRTWILFFDTDFQSRWIGIWEGAPPPPMPDFEDD